MLEADAAAESTVESELREIAELDDVLLELERRSSRRNIRSTGAGSPNGGDKGWPVGDLAPTRSADEGRAKCGHASRTSSRSDRPCPSKRAEVLEKPKSPPVVGGFSSPKD